MFVRRSHQLSHRHHRSAPTVRFDHAIATSYIKDEKDPSKLMAAAATAKRLTCFAEDVAIACIEPVLLAIDAHEKGTMREGPLAGGLEILMKRNKPDSKLH